MESRGQRVYKPATMSTQTQSRDKKVRRLTIGIVNDKPVTCINTGLKKNTCFNESNPTINVTPSIFIHSGKNVPSCISDCTWLQDCYYTSLGISHKVAEECVSSDSETESEDYTLDKTRVNDIFTNVASMVDLEKISNMNKEDVKLVNSCPSCTADRASSKGGQQSPGQFANINGKHFLSESDPCLCPKHLRREKTSEATCTHQLLVLPQIDIKGTCHIRSPRDTNTDLKPKIERAWGSPELPIKKIPSQFNEETNVLKTPSKSVDKCKSMLNLTNNGSVRITLDNVRSVNHNSTSFPELEMKTNFSPRYSQDSPGEYAFKYGSDSKLAGTKTWDTGHLTVSCPPIRKLYHNMATTESIAEYLPTSIYDPPAELTRCVSTPMIHPPPGPCPERRSQRVGVTHRTSNRPISCFPTDCLTGVLF